MLRKPSRYKKAGTKDENCHFREGNRKEKLSCKGHMSGAIQLRYESWYLGWNSV